MHIRGTRAEKEVQIYACCNNASLLTL
jgi:hypothetical protein